MYVPAASVVELAVTKELPPKHGENAPTHVKPVRLGFALTMKEAVLLTVVAVEQPVVLAMAVTVTVVVPAAVSLVDGIVNVPELPLIIKVAVLPVDELAPLKL